MVRVGVVTVGEQFAPRESEDVVRVGEDELRLGVLTVGEQSATQPG
jgi:hypothetical protein